MTAWTLLSWRHPAEYPPYDRRTVRFLKDFGLAPHIATSVSARQYERWLGFASDLSTRLELPTRGHVDRLVWRYTEDLSCSGCDRRGVPLISAKSEHTDSVPPPPNEARTLLCTVSYAAPRQRPPDRAPRGTLSAGDLADRLAGPCLARVVRSGPVVPQVHYGPAP